MLKQLKSASIPTDLLTTLNSGPENSRGGEWENRTKEVTDFKKIVLDHGLKEQEDRCVWCGLLTGEKGHQRADRDHIAPKGKYPQWTFEPLNIAISCEYCNGFSVKNNLDTVRVVNAIYSESDFFIVHPYLDNPATHLTFSFSNGREGVTVTGLTEKGRWTIEKMQLDSTSLTMERAKEVNYLNIYGTLPQHLQSLVMAASAGL